MDTVFDYEYLKQQFLELTGLNLSLYKEKQMRRRINTLIERKGFEGYGEYVEKLKTDPAELAQLVGYITINVTEFFRTPEHWRTLETEVLPELASHAQNPLRIWSCACSTGEEPYSVAMSMARVCPAAPYHIVATDVDDEVLQQAGEGLYTEKALEKIPQALRDAFFARHGAEWAISEELKAHVEFRHLDLLKDPYPADCDLILCRNVLIYFTAEAQQEIYHRFKQSLRPGGALFMGNTEQILQYREIGLQKQAAYLYWNR